MIQALYRYTLMKGSLVQVSLRVAHNQQSCGNPAIVHTVFVREIDPGTSIKPAWVDLKSQQLMLANNFFHTKACSRVSICTER